MPRRLVLGAALTGLPLLALAPSYLTGAAAHREPQPARTRPHVAQVEVRHEGPTAEVQVQLLNTTPHRFARVRVTCDLYRFGRRVTSRRKVTRGPIDPGQARWTLLETEPGLRPHEARCRVTDAQR